MNLHQEYNRSVKFLLVGDVSANKSRILSCIDEQNPNSNHVTTIGVDSKDHIIQFRQDCRVKLILWDTGGREHHLTIDDYLCRGVHVFCCVFSFTDQQSFEHLKVWVKDAKKKKDAGSQVIILGNHCLQPNLEVTNEEAQDFAMQNDVLFAAVDDTNYDTVRNALILALNHLPYLAPAVAPPAPANNRDQGGLCRIM